MWLLGGFSEQESRFWEGGRLTVLDSFVFIGTNIFSAVVYYVW